jgi:hypothetical protein
MKASEVIKSLQKLIEEHGDLDVYVNTPYEQTDIEVGEFVYDTKNEHYKNMFGQECTMEERFTAYL